MSAGREFTSDASTRSDGGIERSVSVPVPLYFLIVTPDGDPAPTAARVFVFMGFDDDFEFEDRIAEADITDYIGAPLDEVIHTSEVDRLEALPAIVLEAIRTVQREIQEYVETLD